MIDKLKWVGAVLVAGLFIVLGIVYGKETLSVLRARLKAKDAGSNLIKKKIERLELEVKQSTSEAEARRHEATADTLRIRLDDIRKAKEEDIARSGGYRLSDEDKAEMDNAARRARRSSRAG